MDYCCAMERQDLHQIDKLNRLKDTRTFWNDVRKLTKTVRSDHSIGRWQILAEVRYGELCDIENCMSISRVLEENGICASVDSCGGFFCHGRNSVGRLETRPRKSQMACI